MWNPRRHWYTVSKFFPSSRGRDYHLNFLRGNRQVSRPLFIEEHGLRLLLSHSGVGVELPRAAYEAGEWAEAIEDAWMKGQERKRVRSILGDVGGKRRDEEGREMARQVVGWVEEWQGFDSG